MKDCNNVTIPMVSTSQQDRNTVIGITVTERIEACEKFNTRDPIAIVGADSEYYLHNKPIDAFNCREKACTNTGSFLVTRGDAEGTISVKYRQYFDAEEFATGVVTFYVAIDAQAGSTIPIDFTISDFSDVPQANSDVYTTMVTLPDDYVYDEFIPIVVRFDVPPTSVTGTGWTPSDDGVIVSVGTADESVTRFEVSTFSYFKSIEELENMDTVLVSCLDSFADDFSIEP